MTRTLVSLLLLVGLGVSACEENVLDPMADRQRRAMRYKQSSFYDDGLSMRAPPEGTVPRERITLNPRLTTGREPDGPTQSNGEPLPVYVIARQMSLRPPPSLHKYVDRPAGYFFEVATRGFGMMASYAAELTVEERWAVVAYIRALQLSQLTAAAEIPPEARQQIEALPPGVSDPPPPKHHAPGTGHSQSEGHGGPDPHEQPMHEEKR